MLREVVIPFGDSGYIALYRYEPSIYRRVGLHSSFVLANTPSPPSSFGLLLHQEQLWPRVLARGCGPRHGFSAALDFINGLRYLLRRHQGWPLRAWLLVESLRSPVGRARNCSLWCKPPALAPATLALSAASLSTVHAKSCDEELSRCDEELSRLLITMLVDRVIRDEELSRITLLINQ